MKSTNAWIVCAALGCVLASCNQSPNEAPGSGNAPDSSHAPDTGEVSDADKAPDGGKQGAATKPAKAGSVKEAQPSKVPPIDPGTVIGVEAPSDVAAPPPDAKKTKTGLAYVILKEGKTSGKKPHAWDTVKVHYSGWTTDGKRFDSSVVRGQPLEFPLHAVIPGWIEGLQLMKEGDAARFWIPGNLAYDGQPGRPQGTLVFDVELLAIKAQPKPPETPSDVAAPPKDAKRTRKGVSYKVLKKGTGTRHPKATDRVEVHYSGWTTDGKLFDSSVQRGQKITFGLNEVIPGWTDGLQVMVEGEKTRFWIPAHLAYQGQPGQPQGMLVFDVELFKIK